MSVSTLRDAMIQDLGSMTHSKLVEFHILSHRASTQAKTSARFGVSAGLTSQALQMGWAVIREGKTHDVVRKIIDYIDSVLNHHGCIQAKYLSILLRRKGITDREIDFRHIMLLLELDSEREPNFFILDNDHNLVRNKLASNDNLLVSRNIWDPISRKIKTLITIGKQRGVVWAPLQSKPTRCMALLLENYSGIICSWRTSRAIHVIPANSRLTRACETAFFRSDSLPINRLVPALCRALRAQAVSTLIKNTHSMHHCRDYPHHVETMQLLRIHPHCHIVGSSVYWCGRRLPLGPEQEILVAVITSLPISWTYPQLREQLKNGLKSASLPHSPISIRRLIRCNPLLHENTIDGRRSYRYHLIDDNPLL